MPRARTTTARSPGRPVGRLEHRMLILGRRVRARRRGHPRGLPDRQPAVPARRRRGRGLGLRARHLRRRPPRRRPGAAAARESELRHAYELELEREVAARREYELELENELRRETEDSMRDELDALRGDIAALSGLRDEVARVSALRGDIAALTGLRDAGRPGRRARGTTSPALDVAARRSSASSPSCGPTWAGCGPSSPSSCPARCSSSGSSCGPRPAGCRRPGRRRPAARSTRVELDRRRPAAGADRRLAGRPPGRAAGDPAVRAGARRPHPAPPAGADPRRPGRPWQPRLGTARPGDPVVGAARPGSGRPGIAAWPPAPDRAVAAPHRLDLGSPATARDAGQPRRRQSYRRRAAAARHAVEPAARAAVGRPLVASVEPT